MSAARRKPRRLELAVTLDDYERLLEAQGGGCALCGNPPKTRRLDVDHDHRTGLIRGLLCSRCNQAVPSERQLPAEWALRLWSMHLKRYTERFPYSYGPEPLRVALDEINGRRQDGERV